jgi:Anti-sigma factor NepR
MAAPGQPRSRRTRGAAVPPVKDVTQTLKHASDSGDLNLSPDLQAHLGRQLRASYQQLVEEPVPDRFLKLLDSLEKTAKDT